MSTRDDFAQRAHGRIMPKGHGLLSASTLVVLLAVLSRAIADERNDPSATSSAEISAAGVKTPGRFEARYSDGSILKLSLMDSKIPMKTDYGMVLIPVADIRWIDFATRNPDEMAERIEAAVEKLGDGDFKVRENASADLLALERAAYPALLAAVGGNDPEVVLRADRLLNQIRALVREEDLRIQAFDVICAGNSQIVGTVDMQSLKVDTAPFGRQQLRLVDLRKRLAEAEIEREPADGLPDPGNLVNYRNQTGKTLYFRVSAPAPGLLNGIVWGSDIYTFDSTLALAAVHAGVLKPGQTKVIGVTILGPQDSFGSSTRNGVMSNNWGAYPAAFKFKTPVN